MWIALDIGVLHLGIVLMDHHDSLTLRDFDCVDITKCTHHRIAASDCKLHHTACAYDRVSHFIQEWQPLFDQAELVFIEQQPPTGLKDIEQLFVSFVRDKVIMISPVALHHHFQMQHLSYDQRKQFSCNKALQYCQPNLQKWFSLPRTHDVADAILMCYFHYERMKPKPSHVADAMAFLESFRF